RSQATTSAPARASATAWLRPWPRPAPVTSATRPVSASLTWRDDTRDARRSGQGSQGVWPRHRDPALLPRVVDVLGRNRQAQAAGMGTGDEAAHQGVEEVIVGGERRPLVAGRDEPGRGGLESCDARSELRP